MKNKNRIFFWVGASFIAAFTVWTALVLLVDVAAIGPLGTKVGLSGLNGFFHSLTGVNMTLYAITDWLGLVPLSVAFGFAVLGLVQLIKRKSIRKVDRSILVLGAFYLVVIAVYLLFEVIVINYRPTLIEEQLEVSYPSSTTLLVTCIMPTAAMQLKTRIGNAPARRFTVTAIIAFTAFMVLGRLLSGVHWISDIIGGALFSIGVVLIYAAASGTFDK